MGKPVLPNDAILKISCLGINLGRQACCLEIPHYQEKITDFLEILSLGDALQTRDSSEDKAK